MKLFAVLAVVFASAAAEPYIHQKPTTAVPASECQARLAAAGANVTMFPGDAAHVTHSITLRALRRLEPNAKAENGILTVNMDLYSLDALLPDAPDRDADSAKLFQTEGMRLLDSVMTHMDDDHWSFKGYSTLERIAHVFHMSELFAKVEEFYRLIKAMNPDAATCACARDQKATGVYAAMRKLALAIRYPEVAYGSRNMTKYTLHIGGQEEEKKATVAPQKYTFSIGDEDKYTFSLAKKPMPALESEAAWKQWRGDASPKTVQRVAYNAALYIYCSLN